MQLPSAEVLGLAYGVSEVGLGFFKRSGTQSQATDRSSLRVLWVVILCSVGAAVLATRVLPHAYGPVLMALYPLGVALFAAGLALRWWSILHLGRLFTVDVAIHEDHALIESGPYRLLRHPAYAGALLAFLGFGICLGNWVALLAVTVPITWAFMRRIVIEEQALNGALGESYAAYARRTKRLVPYLY